MKGRVGLLGGTFNPIHNGHLFLALEAIHLMGLERVVFIPNRVPPHKAPPGITASVRLTLLEAALKGVPGFSFSTIELEREGPSYTIDTLEALGPPGEFVFICGADAFTSPWHRLQDVVERLHGLVIARRSGLPATLPPALQQLPERLHDKFELMEFPPIAISSTEVRERIAEQRPFRFLIPDPVYRIITESGFYRTRSNTIN